MYTMDQIHTIRDIFFNQGLSMAETAEKVGCDWRTVKKYVDKADFSPPKPTAENEKTHKSKLEPYKTLIDSWLIADKKSPRKQRHTARRIHARLKEEVPGYNCCYRVVAYYVSQRKKELNLKNSENYIPLIHHPGEAQADFGDTVFYENGYYHENGKHLVLSFPYSNGAYMQLNYGANMECLLEGLQAMFECMGGVPTEIWFDNASTMVSKVIKGGGREMTKRFALFCEHYRIRPVFMNPESGWEKGNVEEKVGYLRRNLFVPIPEFPKLNKKNEELLQACEQDMQREHYDKKRTIWVLFQEDKAALLPLPAVRFDTAGYGSAVTDKYGRFTLNDGKHRYSASPEFCQKPIQYKLTSAEVVVMDQDMHEIVRHRRLYGEKEAESMDWLPYLKYIARKPRSLRNSGIYEMMPENLQKFMDTCSNTERGQILKTLSDLTDRTGFDSALRTVDEAIQMQVNDSDSLKNLYRRLYSDVPVLPPLDSAMDSPLGKIIPFPHDLSSYDAALRGGTHHG